MIAIKFDEKHENIEKNLKIYFNYYQNEYRKKKYL